MLGSMLYWLFVLFKYLALPGVVVVAALALFKRDLFCYLWKMALFYASISMSAFFTCFGALATYSKNEGCMMAMRSFNVICSFWLDVEIEVRGSEKIEAASGPEQNPVVIISNHQSSLDLITMSEVWPSKCTAMMKHSLKYIPIFNVGAILSNSIFVDRSSKEKAREALKDAIEVMIEKKLKIWMFPEGTRHHQHGLLPFKKGAFNIAVGGHFPIIPVVISDYRHFYSKPKGYFRLRGQIIVQVMDPVPTEGLTYEDVVTLCDRIQSDMAETYENISKEAGQKQTRLTTTTGQGRS